MATITVQPGPRKGVISVPPSKSDTQRALLCAALAKGESVIDKVGNSQDEQAMLQAIVDLGASVTPQGNGKYTIVGIQAFPKNVEIHVHESGLGARLLTAVCAAGQEKITVTGSGSLISRTMEFYRDVLPQFGVHLFDFNGHLPITVQGPMVGNNLEIDGSISSQFISGLLLALPLAKGVSHVKIKNLASRPYVDMTLKTLHAFGIEIEKESTDLYSIPGGQQFTPTNYVIEGDWSAASCWMTAAALGADLIISGLSASSAQADKQMLAALMSAGCSVHVTSEGLRVNGTNKQPFEFDANDCPDLFPALVTLAAYIPGKSILHGAHRLIHKESNRAEALCSEFLKLGITIEHLDNELHIHGKSTIKGGEVQAHNDHRIAMTLGICGLFSKDPIVIQGSESVSKSYPTFWEDLDALVH
ncbi:MAG: 3-phosphoshikimate 1-carboxyvinyltransferase [Flavobacteriia bacterium]